MTPAAASVVTTCGECLAACGIVVDRNGRVSGDESNPITRGYVCANGKASIGLVGHPGRLRTPLVRGAPTSWPEALDIVARAVKRSVAEGGPDAVGLYFGAGDPAGSMAFLSSAAFLRSVGSTRHYNVLGLEATHRYVVAEAMFGSPLAVPRPDLERTGGLLAIGTNPLVSNDEGGVAAAIHAIDRRHGVLVVLDPRRTELARKATVHLQLRPGTDAEVLLAMLHVLFDERASTHLGVGLAGIERLRALATEMPPERAAAIADVPASDLVAAARLLFAARPFTALSRLGASMTRRGTLVEWLSWALVGIAGGLDREGGLLHNPGFLDLEGMMKRAPRPPGSILGVLPPAEMADAILDDGPGRLRTLIVVAADLLESVPNTQKVERALRKLDALVVLDVMPTPTTDLATAVLPCAHHLEKDDVALLLPDRTPKRYVRASRPVGRPPGVARTEVAIFGELAERLGRPLFVASPVDRAVRLLSLLERGPERHTPKAVMRAVLPFLSKLSLGWRRLAEGYLGPEDGRLADGALHGFAGRAGRSIDVAPVRFVDALRASIDGGTLREIEAHADTLTLSTCTRSRDFVNTKMILVGRAAKEAIVHVSRADAAHLTLEEGDEVDVETAAGTLAARVHVDEALRSGAASMYFGTPGLNRLTDDADVDPL